MTPVGFVGGIACMVAVLPLCAGVQNAGFFSEWASRRQACLLHVDVISSSPHPLPLLASCVVCPTGPPSPLRLAR